MNKRLSVTSRILVAFASGALIAVFFLPAWRIDLFAPQYPEGLTMNIWINGLSGDVDVINGLNHYIGMRHITIDMFPEFKFLPYVVGFFMLLGVIVSITGRRKYLFFYLILTAIGGAAALIDFYRWGYRYGHHLDPTAPIQIEGFSYQPPLIGHKKILNFDAYSFPDIGGWIVITAAALAFTVWFLEWYHQRKALKIQTANTLPSILALALITLLISSCSPKPEPIQYGTDNCYFCKMGIADPKFGGEVVTKKTRVYKFDDLICMIRFLKSGVLAENQLAKILVINAEKKNDFLDAKKSFYLMSPELRSPMGSNTLAFSGTAAADQFRISQPGEILNWEELNDRIR